MVTRLVEKLRRANFVAVVGPSGCGKSSLVRAGLLLALRKGALPGSASWQVEIFRPSDDPLRALATALIAGGLSNDEIAGQLALSENTVSDYASYIHGKLQVTDRAQAVVRAQEAGLGEISV